MNVSTISDKVCKCKCKFKGLYTISDKVCSSTGRLFHISGLDTEKSCWTTVVLDLVQIPIIIIIIIIIIINSSTDIEKFAYKKLQLMSRNGKVITTLTAAHK